LRIAAACWAIAAWAQKPPTQPATPPNSSPPASTSAPVKKKPDTERVPKFASRLAENAELSSRVQALLPKGVTLPDAAKGFKSETGFLATLHASHDLNIPFDQFKSDVTSGERDSLAQAIRKFRPEFDMKTVENSAKTAEQQAKTDVRETRETSTKSSKE
jgi:hypothetical protein